LKTRNGKREENEVSKRSKRRKIQEYIRSRRTTDRREQTREKNKKKIK